MAFAYSGLLGVYITAVFSKRGSTASVIAALAVGFVVVMLFQPFTIDVLGLPEALKKIAFPWHLCVGVTVSTLVCLIGRSEEHTSELQSLMRISYAVFCLKKKNTTHQLYNHLLLYQ